MARTASTSKSAPDLLLLHIKLKGITPTIWRRFAVPENITLGRLHHVIQLVMGWDDFHMHEFEIAGERYGTPDPEGWGPEVKSEARKTVIKALNGKKTFDYIYDFGDDWRHHIKIEKKLPAVACPRVPYCIDGANACPPEDVGGGPGYEDFLQAMADPEHPEHDAMLGWYGEAFDPAAFDCERVNRLLERQVYYSGC